MRAARLTDQKLQVSEKRIRIGYATAWDGIRQDRFFKLSGLGIANWNSGMVDAP